MIKSLFDIWNNDVNIKEQTATKYIVISMHANDILKLKMRHDFEV